MKQHVAFREFLNWLCTEAEQKRYRKTNGEL